MTREVVLDETAIEDLERVPTDLRATIMARIESLADDPAPAHSADIGWDLPDFRMLRVGDYRVAYWADADRVAVYRVCARADLTPGAG